MTANLTPFGVVGHRGARAIRPENSLDGFRYAMDNGVRGVELDVRLSLDEQLVCSHDPSPARLGGPTTLVSQMTAAELGELRLRGGVPIPRLEDVMNLLSSNVGFIVEVKNDPAQPDFRNDRRAALLLAEFLEERRRMGWPDHIRNVSSFDHESSSVFAAHAPNLGHCAALLSEGKVSAEVTLREAVTRKIRHIHPHYTSVLRRPSVARKASELGVSVSCWTVNSTSVARVLNRIGVATIISDDPVRLAKVWRDTPSR